MILLAGFTLKGPMQAALVMAAFALLGLLFPPLAWLSAGALVLVTLARGVRQGLMTQAIAFAGTVLLSWLIFGQVYAREGFDLGAAFEMVLFIVLLVWLPAWLVATALQISASMGFALQLLTVMALLAVLAIYGLYADMGEAWRPMFDELVNEVGSMQDAETLVALQQFEQGLIRLMPGLLIGSLLLNTLISLFLGRWWQAVYYNPGGFGREFRSLSLGKLLSLVAAAVLAAAMWQPQPWLISLAIIVMMMFTVQGVAMLHSVFYQRKLHLAWLVLVYLLLSFIPQLMFLLALLAMADAWLDIRRRLAPPAAS